MKNIKDKIRYGNGITYGVHDDIQAMDIAHSIHTEVDAQFYDARYPEYEFPETLLPEQIITDINPGATNYAMNIRDLQGTAAFIGNGPSNNIPMVGQAVSSAMVPIGYCAIGSEITNEDARQYTFGFGGSLAMDLGTAMRRGVDNLKESTFFFGNEALGFMPYVNYPGIPQMTVAAGASGQTPWPAKTPEEIRQDFNAALDLAWNGNRMIFKPEYIKIPGERFSYLASTYLTIGTTGIRETILENLKTQNVITAITGQPLTIVPSRYLSDAGEGGTARMILVERKRENQIMPDPMPYTLNEPVQIPLGAQWYAEAKFGSFYVAQKGSMLYVDGI